ncbi:MAG: GNAT family N-acetyltransferase [Clostridium sp.]
MGRQVEFKGVKYSYEFEYRDNDILRKSFNSLAAKTFDIDFEEWYKGGYWGNGYIPHSLVLDNVIVANVSVSIMYFKIFGKKKKYIQLGTVMTESDYRGAGLSRFLMEEVLKEWEDKCDLIYLFANDSVLDFYPRFGFKETTEYECSLVDIKKSASNSKRVRKIDMSNDNDIITFKNIINNSKEFSPVAVLDNTSVIMFYCTSFMKENVYYIEEDETIVIASYDDTALNIQEIFSFKEVELNSIIEKMIINDVDKVILGFTPFDKSGYKESILRENDTTLFVKEGKINPFKINKLRFPELSHT